MKKIQVMSDVLANKIAAGEIIERPLSVVKELVENALDAGATDLKIELIEGGLTEISVTDNGHGMDLYNLENCTKRHSTSKLYSDEDLFKIKTLGFRGEALASIFVVSKMEIITASDNNGGYKLTSFGDGEYEINDIACNKGTSICVKNLFFNTPVRYKYLSNHFYELSLIATFINKVALSSPHLKLELINDSKQLFKTNGNGQMDEIFSKVYSNEIAKGILYSEIETDDFRVNVVMADPKFTRSKRNFITITVNDRIVRNYKIESQIIKTYKEFLHTNQFPILVINIYADYSFIDVNIHPTKQEVNISLIDELNVIIDKAISSKLDSYRYVPNVSLDNENSFSDEMKIMESKFDIVNNYQTFEHTTLEIKDSSTDEIKETKNDIIINKKRKIPEFDYIGTYKNTYLLFQNKDGLHLVDQHAAQERINYEKFMQKFQNREFKYQQLLIPIVIELTTEEFLTIGYHLEVFKEIGINLEVFGHNAIKVVEIDRYYLKAKSLENDIKNLYDDLMKNKKLDFAKFYEDAAIMMACKSSIKANDYINTNDVISLMNQLDACEFPYTCPHGRPNIINISEYEIEKLFKRVF